jgi:hypothetical protein
MKTFTKDFIRENSGCYENKDINYVNALDFMSEQGDAIPYTWILESSIPTTDKYWFFCKKVFTEEQNQQVAIGAASIVLDIFESKYPNDDRPRKAINAAEDYIKKLITAEELRIARNNAVDAVYAYSDYAAYSSAAAAHAASVAYSSAAAAHAVIVYADASVEHQEALLLFLIMFCNQNL